MSIDTTLTLGFTKGHESNGPEVTDLHHFRACYYKVRVSVVSFAIFFVFCLLFSEKCMYVSTKEVSMCLLHVTRR